ncbi:nucleoside triphosphate pyrophosphohydrolase family protein [Halomonas pacifica]|uniref:nucleoside triphosphate pyrophosphohydrolase family protein n=1 Tax=Bisbaumannia pacifica TaxID=77098 RepID=UPI002359C3AE|nr:nucleoside triphosphate pyrophosphohydrolase family protein [Halomonas pacifica]MDC8802776.1 nucleoside triphosphate pyrophosphohydrolase family protein [Halomonas pacifica]
MNKITADSNVMLSRYEDAVSATDRFFDADITPVLLGLFGEVGSVMSASKKLHREKSAYTGYQRNVEEELGDTLWYITALCRRLSINLSDIFSEVLSGDGFSVCIAANSDPMHPVAKVVTTENIVSLDSVLLRLGGQAARLMEIDVKDVSTRQCLLDFVKVYIEAVQASGVSFSAVVKGNMNKACGRFMAPSTSDLTDFDIDFPLEEQLPRYFEIQISSRADGRSYLRWNGVFIGDPLSDNIADRDGYRFHDVFHLANAAILHWSPTFRALIKHKRKSKPAVDEAQDSGRAIVIDEGLSAYIFSCAKELDFFEGQKSVSFDLLKAVSNFVRGYEVEACPLYLWECSILQGYEVFRQLRKNNGGVIIGDRSQRTLQYRNLSEQVFL